MKFNLKLFVLVGVLAGFRDVYGTDEVKNKDDDFIVDGLKNTKEAKEVNDAMEGMRVIKAVYETKVAGDVGIINADYKEKLSKAFVCAWNVEDGVTEVDNFGANSADRLVHDMQPNVKYTVYFIFKEECFGEGSVDKLLLSTSWMFEGCPNLIRADFRFFNTTNVTYMSYMFFNCTSLTELDLSKFDTKNVTHMSYMFYNCSSLTKLDLSKFDTTKVTDMNNMFTGWTSYQQVFLPSTCAEKKKRCICCGDEYVRWNNHEVGGLKPGITKFKFPDKINLMIHTEK